jgi:LacI family transcriptional regulator
MQSTQWELADIITSVSEEVEQAGLLVAVQSTSLDPERELSAILAAHREHSAGVILYSADDTRNVELLVRLQTTGYPVVLIDSPSPFVDLPYVASENVSGGRLQAEAVLDPEVKDAFYFVSQGEDGMPLATRSSIRERYSGFLRTLFSLRPDSVEYHDLQLDNHLFGVSRETLEDSEARHHRFSGAIDWVDRWLERVSFPVGAACLNDGVARWLIEYLIFRGVSVPDEVRVVGYDDAIVHLRGSVALSSVRQNFTAMGTAAADLLLRQINGRPLEQHAVRLPVELVHRESTIAAPRSH